MRASRPAAGPPLPLLQLLTCPAYAAFTSHVLLGVLYPTDELIAGKRQHHQRGLVNREPARLMRLRRLDHDRATGIVDCRVDAQPRPIEVDPIAPQSGSSPRRRPVVAASDSTGARSG